MIGGNDPHVIIFHVSGKQHMEYAILITGTDKIAWQIFILGILLYDLIVRNGIKDHVSRNESTFQPHIYIISPQNSALRHTAPDKFYRIVWKYVARGH